MCLDGLFVAPTRGPVTEDCGGHIVRWHPTQTRRLVRAFILPIALLLMGCASTVATEIPLAPEVYNMTLWQRDLDLCRGHALAAKKGLSAKAIGGAGFGGAAQNAGSAPINWLIPVAGAAGGIVYETFEEFGLTDRYQQQVFVKCLDRKTGWDHSALEIQPNP